MGRLHPLPLFPSYETAPLHDISQVVMACWGEFQPRPLGSSPHMQPGARVTHLQITPHCLLLTEYGVSWHYHCFSCDPVPLLFLYYIITFLMIHCSYIHYVHQKWIFASSPTPS
jgi:hypothetical protein